MYFWILTIFYLQDRLKTLADKLDKDAMNEALFIGGDTFKAYCNILRLNDNKLGVINLNVLLDKMKKEMSIKDLFIISSYAKGSSHGDIAFALSMPRSSVSKRIKRLIAKCQNVLYRLGYNEKRFFHEYKKYAPVNRIYRKIKKREMMLHPLQLVACN